MCERLGLERQNVEVSISGINQVVSKIKNKCLVIILFGGPQIVDSVPGQKLNISHLDIPSHLNLADPDFHKPGGIDVLLGAEIFYNLLCIGQINLGNESKNSLQKTRLGWVVTGSIVEEPSKRNSNGQFVVEIPLLDSPLRLGDSKEYALNRFLALEKRFLKQPKVKEIALQGLMSLYRQSILGTKIKSKLWVYIGHFRKMS
ncbi:hypothetical protein NQ317_018014 [Molorchus minor]|uniref:Peptidase aspartic putative domain-containing protein n=1 Tax=Molorchus minor TaxID=1323400 RepID=A0ABQ9JT39_9CUCU|nr:hypothetical protein NQ317_018014 [Molorchus minor]